MTRSRTADVNNRKHKPTRDKDARWVCSVCVGSCTLLVGGQETDDRQISFERMYKRGTNIKCTLEADDRIIATNVACEVKLD